MSKYSTFKYGDGTKYGAGDWTANLLWTFIVAWSGEYTGENEANRMVDLTVRRGRRWILDNGGLAQFPVGEAVAVFDNSDGRYDPWNTDSPLYPNVSPGKFVRIAVKDNDAGTNYGVMRGKIADITMVRRGAQETARIKIVDGLSWLSGQTVNIGLNTDIGKSGTISQILDHSNWPSGLSGPMAAEWPRGVTENTDQFAYWWAWNQNAMQALKEINQAEWAVAFHNREGTFNWRPRDYAYARSINIDQSELLADIGRPNPWEVVRNIVRVRAHPKVLDAINDIVWQLESIPAIAAGETFYIEPLFKWEEWFKMCGSSITFAFTVNTQADGGGADLSASCTLTFDTDIGEGARIWLTNNSISDGYITLLKTTGDAIYAPSIDIREATDGDSLAKYGPRTLEVTSRWVEDTEWAQTLADWLLSEFKDPEQYPVIQIQQRPHTQYYPDLYDLVNLTAPTLDIRHAFRVGAIEHQWLSENGQSVLTTMHLEPYMQYGGDTVVYQGCQVVRSSNQSIPDNTATEILWNAEDHDVGSYHSLVANTDRVTIPAGQGGYYAVFCTIQWAGNATGSRLVRIQKNGVTVREGVVEDISEANDFDQHVRQTISLAAEDYVTIEVKQTSGGALNVQADSVLSVDYLGA